MKTYSMAIKMQALFELFCYTSCSKVSCDILLENWQKMIVFRDFKERSITLYTDYYNNLIYSVILKQILCIERH